MPYIQEISFLEYPALESEKRHGEKRQAKENSTFGEFSTIGMEITPHLRLVIALFLKTRRHLD
jgi:hypothetical protein